MVPHDAPLASELVLDILGKRGQTRTRPRRRSEAVSSAGGDRGDGASPLLTPHPLAGPARGIGSGSRICPGGGEVHGLQPGPADRDASRTPVFQKDRHGNAGCPEKPAGQLRSAAKVGQTIPNVQKSLLEISAKELRTQRVKDTASMRGDPTPPENPRQPKL